MSSFNEKFIQEIKLFHSEESFDNLIEEKYSFLKYVFKNLESIDGDELDICEEEFSQLNSNIDAYYYDEESSTYNLYIAIYNDHIGEQVISKELFNETYNKIKKFVEMVVTGKYINYDESSFTYEIANSIHASLKNSEIIVNIISNYIIETPLKKDDIEEINNIFVSFRTYDLLDLENKFKQLNNTNFELNCMETFDEDLNALRITTTPDFDVYLCSMKGIHLARLYKEDNIRLLEQNVRSYLKRTARVNAGILETIKNNPEQFVSYNNGIAAVATGVSIDKFSSSNNLFKIQKIMNFQIVNGGQTTATLYECFKDKLIENLNNINVPVKLTVVKNVSNAEYLIRNISVFSNTQTAIKKSDPPSNLPYYVSMKKLSRGCLSQDSSGNSYICYFERTSGEYDTEFRRNNGTKRFTISNPKDKKFTKIELAVAINCWEQIPHKVCEGKEKNFAFFNDMVKNQLFDPNEEYFKNAYATIVLFRKLDKLAKKMKLTYKSNVVSYALSYLSYIYEKRLDLTDIWNNKDISESLKEIATEVLLKVHKIIENTPPEHPEARMWARKEKCWNLVKSIKIQHIILKTDRAVEFYPKNDALVYISSVENMYNSILWMKLLLWNNKAKELSTSELRMVKYMKTFVDGKEKSLTKKQIEYVKDIFLHAVKSGFKY